MINVIDKPDIESEAIIKEELGSAIPKERYDAAITAKDVKYNQLQTQFGLLQNQMDLLKANMPQRDTQQAKQPDMLEGIFTEDDTVVDKNQLKEGFNRLVTYINNLSSQVSSIVAQSKHSDFDDVLQNNLPNVLKADPSLVGELQELYKINPARAASMAYRIGKTDPAYQEKINKEKTAQSEEQTLKQKIAELVKNKSLPQSISSIGTGGGATTGGGSKLLEVLNNFQTSADFEKFHKGLLAGAEKIPKE